MVLAELVYRETASFPVQERYGLTSQMRRCAVSAVANIAEGKGRYGSRQFVAFLDIAHGSLRELQALTALATRLDFLAPETQDRLDEATSHTIGQLLKLAQWIRGRTQRKPSRLPLPATMPILSTSPASPTSPTSPT